MRRPCAAFLSALRFAPPGFCPSFAFRSAWLLLCAPAWLSLLRYAHAWLLPCVAFCPALALRCIPLRFGFCSCVPFGSCFALRSAWSLPRVAFRPALALRCIPLRFGFCSCVPFGSCFAFRLVFASRCAPPGSCSAFPPRSYLTLRSAWSFRSSDSSLCLVAFFRARSARFASLTLFDL